MRAVVQRVSQARVEVDGEVCGAIDKGLLILVGVAPMDTGRDVAWLADKIVHLRVFDDEAGQMNRSLLDVGGQLLIVSQFTLYGDCRKGRRPSWSAAAPPDYAEPLYLDLIETCRRLGAHCMTGRFQAAMEINLTNNGPVTLLLDSSKHF